MRSLIAIFALILTMGLAHAESDFYKGKKIRLVSSLQNCITKNKQYYELKGDHWSVLDNKDLADIIYTYF